MRSEIGNENNVRREVNRNWKSLRWRQMQSEKLKKKTKGWNCEHAFESLSLCCVVAFEIVKRLWSLLLNLLVAGHSSFSAFFSFFFYGRRNFNYRANQLPHHKSQLFKNTNLLTTTLVLIIINGTFLKNSNI